MWSGKPFDAHCCHMGTAIKHYMSDRGKPSFVIFDICTLWRSECPDVKNYKWRLNPIWHMMLYNCTHMATVGVKGLERTINNLILHFCIMTVRTRATGVRDRCPMTSLVRVRIVIVGALSLTSSTRTTTIHSADSESRPPSLATITIW